METNQGEFYKSTIANKAKLTRKLEKMNMLNLCILIKRHKYTVKQLFSIPEKCSVKSNSNQMSQNSPETTCDGILSQ